MILEKAENFMNKMNAIAEGPDGLLYYEMICKDRQNFSLSGEIESKKQMIAERQKELQNKRKALEKRKEELERELKHNESEKADWLSNIANQQSHEKKKLCTNHMSIVSNLQKKKENQVRYRYLSTNTDFETFNERVSSLRDLIEYSFSRISEESSYKYEIVQKTLKSQLAVLDTILIRSQSFDMWYLHEYESIKKNIEQVNSEIMNLECNDNIKIVENLYSQDQAQIYASQIRELNNKLNQQKRRKSELLNNSKANMKSLLDAQNEFELLKFKIEKNDYIRLNTMGKLKSSRIILDELKKENQFLRTIFPKYNKM